MIRIIGWVLRELFRLIRAIFWLVWDLLIFMLDHFRF